MEEYHLGVSLNQINNEINDTNLGATKLLHTIKTISDESMLQFLHLDYSEWTSENLKIISNSFVNGKSNYFYQDLKRFYYKNSRFTNLTSADFSRKLSMIKRSIHNQLNFFQRLLDLIRIGDYLKFPEKIKIREYNEVRANELIELVLKKLYLFNNDNYYSLKEILFVNGIINISVQNEIEFAGSLETKGLIKDASSSDGAVMKISFEGKEYVEDEIIYKDSQNDGIEFKLDLIIYHLQLLGLGQEIIYDDNDSIRESVLRRDKNAFLHSIKSAILGAVASDIIKIEKAQKILTSVLGIELD